jgi:nitrogen fixation/metabolism regulation signal transduction histidine kinase
MRRFRIHFVHEQRMQLLALAAGLPSIITAVSMMFVYNVSDKVRWTLGVLMFGTWLGFAAAIKERVASPLRTLANLLEAMRKGDYSIRGRGAKGEDALGDVMVQVNEMGATLRLQRLEQLEATTLLRKVIDEIDVAIFTFDADRKLRLVNPAGQKLLALPAERLLARSADELGLGICLEGEHTRTIQHTFPSGNGRWGIIRSSFREGGRPHQLIVISDLTRPLREEELQAWQRLVRVLGHELNNSLTPIKSIAESLVSLLSRKPLAEDWEEDMTRGLTIIATRSEGLSRFIGAYARLAKLPRPKFAPIDVDPWIRRVASLETRIHPELSPGPPIVIQGDADQLEQLLINIVRNAADASLETNGKVSIGWAKSANQLEIYVRDEGPGLPNSANLFVPFFTTKPGGSGIGLVLSRQIAEAHGGFLMLKNRTNAPGTEACLTLPL